MTVESGLLESTYKHLSKKAQKIKGWQKIDKNALINSYINCIDNDMKESYLSAIILRYWSKIYKYYNMRPEISKEIYLDLVMDGILKALRRKPWTDSSKKISKELCGPDKTVNRCIKTTVLDYHKHTGTQKSRLNTEAMISFDKSVYDENDDLCVMDNNVYSEPVTDFTSEEIIQYYINFGKIYYAIVVDQICFQNSTKNNKFNIKNLIDSMMGINENYLEYFKDKYSVDSLTINSAVSSLNSKTRRQMTPFVKTIMKNIGKDSTVIRWLSAC